MNNQIIDAKLKDIKIGKRHRKDMGDIAGFAKNIEEVGLLHPIGITPDYELIFGERRLRAYRDVLHRDTIPTRIVKLKSVLLGQITETMIRKDFTITERLAIVDALRCFKHGGDRRSRQDRHSDDEMLTLDDACKRVGLGRDSFYRAKEVEEKGVPDLIRAMDSQKLSVIAARELAQAAQDEQQECLTKRIEEGKATARTIAKHLRRIRNRKDREETLAQAVKISDRNDSIQIHHCAFQNLEGIAGLQPESVHLVCTDIPYGGDFVAEIEDLAAVAKRGLVPGGTFVSYLGQHRLNEKLALLDKHLTYRWMGTSAWDGVGTPVPRLKMVSKNIPWVVYSKGQWQQDTKWIDTFLNSPREKDWHPWQRPLNEVEEFIRYFSQPGDLVVDPCGGGFTTAIACLNQNRRFVGCDIDQVAVVKGQERLAHVASSPSAA